MAVEKDYSVVGVLEDVNATLTVLENYIPRFFRGATDVYYGNLLVLLFSSAVTFAIVQSSSLSYSKKVVYRCIYRVFEYAKEML